jgi:hypothetical protein
MIAFRRNAMKRVLSIAVVLLLTGVSLAHGGNRFDRRTDNSYRWNTDTMGNPRADGYTTSPGSRWPASTWPDGSMRRTEPNSQPRTYDSRGSGSRYDWETGSSYRWYTDPTGTIRVNGFNAETWSTWHTTIKADGSMRGMDSNSQPWTYDRGTGTYMNYGTGEVRHYNRNR